MADLSVFVDESGDVGSNSERHLVALVFHDQSRPVDGEVARLAGRLRELGFPPDRAVHTGPIVRREKEYAGMAVAERKKAFTALFNFCMAARFSYATFSYRKRELGRGGDVAGRLRSLLARDVGLFLRERLPRLSAFDRVIVYYDNGQAAVGGAVREAFGTELFGVEYRRVMPSDYRLFQAADLVCTLELLRLKDAEGGLSRGELAFFGSASRLRKNYLRHIERLRMP